MKNISFVLFLLWSITPVFAAEKQKETVYEHVLRTQTIRCGYAMSPPTLVQDANTGEISGLDYDIWQEIGKELDIKIVWAEEAGWGNYIAGLNAGRYDVFCNQAWPNPGRIKNSTMIGPVTYQMLQAYVRKDDDRFNGNLDRFNKEDITIPAIDGDVSVSMATNRFPNAKIDMLPQMGTSVSDMFMSVLSKKSDVIFLDEAFYTTLSKEHPDALKLVPDVPPVFVYGSYYSVPQGEYAMENMIKIALQRIIDDGRMTALTENYSSSYYVPLKNYEIER